MHPFPRVARPRLPLDTTTIKQEMLLWVQERARQAHLHTSLVVMHQAARLRGPRRQPLGLINRT